jgi:hypothetical protein
MIVTTSDVESLSRSLACWEVAEYACAALVAVACAGEYVADFTDWFTAGIKEGKERLAKRSTLLLIASLALELVCLVKTNSLSGRLIGSLSDKAGAADAKAQSALEKSDTAKQKADAADVAADEAMRKAREAEEYATPRSVSGKQAALIRKRIQSLKGHKMVFFGNFHDTEISDFANRLGEVLDRGIMDVSSGLWQPGMVTPSGMKFGYGKDRKADFDLIVNALDEAGVEKADALRKKASMVGMPDDWLTITFGAKH